MVSLGQRCWLNFIQLRGLKEGKQPAVVHKLRAHTQIEGRLCNLRACMRWSGGVELRFP